MNRSQLPVLISSVAVILSVAAVLVNLQQKPFENQLPKAPTLSLEVKNDSLFITSDSPIAEQSQLLINAFQQSAGNILNRSMVVVDSLAFVNFQYGKLVAEQQLHIRALQTEIARMDSLNGEN